MNKRSSKPAIEAAAAQLRALVFQAEDGAYIGSEDALLAKLGFSRPTVRQAARMLEGQGFLTVRRGNSGGYFGARPDAGTIEGVVSAYLELKRVNVESVTTIATALWVEVVRKAASMRDDAAKTLADKYRERVLAIRPDASFEEIQRVDQEVRTALFELVDNPYVELIFDINIAFARRHFWPSKPSDDAAHREFVRSWREAKLIEFNAISEGDVELGAAAARHTRDIWHRNIWSKFTGEQTR